jgi:hypothetical protein
MNANICRRMGNCLVAGERQGAHNERAAMQEFLESGWV